MTRDTLDTHQFRQVNGEMARYFQQHLADLNLTANDIADIYGYTIEYCADAYYMQRDEKGGDRFARLNVLAAERFAASPAVRSAAAFLTAQVAEIAA